MGQICHVSCEQLATLIAMKLELWNNSFNYRATTVANIFKLIE